MSIDHPKTALTYKNRSGVVYYLHQGRTKNGKQRYFVARSLGDGASGVMPAGFEFGESINGAVSVARINANASLMHPDDIETVRAELARHRHLRRQLHRIQHAPWHRSGTRSCAAWG